MREGWRVCADVERSYGIAVAEPLLGDGDLLVRHGRTPGRRLVLMDSGVPAQWRGRIVEYFARHDVEATVVVVSGGEQCKTVQSVESILDEMRRFDIDRRNEPVVIVGGGAVLDAAGFAASIYRRGVPFIRVPTTLLAYVDASVGIKTSVNFGAAKNLVGSFSPPELVLLDRSFFASLPPREIASGLGEVLKLGLGCDAELFDLLDAHAEACTGTLFGDEIGMQILHRSIDIMIEELEPNIYEHDLCRAVDIGHTFSQAFEMHADEEVRHGEAVALDLNLSAIIAYGRDLIDAEDVRRLADLTVRLGLPAPVPGVNPEAVWTSLLERTKHRAGWQRTPLPSQIGKCIFVDDLRRDEVLAAFDELRGSHFRGARHRRPVRGVGAARPLRSPYRPDDGEDSYMRVFESLVEAYETEGIETASGMNPTLTQDYFAASFTWLVKDGESVTDGLGISPLEVYFLECLAQAKPADRIFVIGNSYGWSTLALALANKGAEVVAIDAGFDLNTITGIDVTNRLAERLGLNLRVVKAVSPQDVGAVVTDLLGHIDLAFVDGYHTPEQIVLDWRAVQPFLRPDSAVLFHDVVFCELLAGFEKIVAESGWTGTVLHGTTTGMGLLVREHDHTLTRLTTAFAGHPGAREVVHAEARAMAHLSGVAQRAEALRSIRQSD